MQVVDKKENNPHQQGQENPPMDVFFSEHFSFPKGNCASHSQATAVNKAAKAARALGARSFRYVLTHCVNGF